VKTARRVVVSSCIAALLLAALMHWGGVAPAELLATVARLPAGTYATALALHVALYLLRTVRFRCLIPPAIRPSFARLSIVCAAHTLAAFVLPAKIGEASFVVYARDVCGLPAAAGVASLVVSRLLDMASLAASFSIACFVLAATGAYPEIDWFVPTGSLLATGAAVLFASSARGDLLVRLAAGITRALQLDRIALGNRVLARVEEVARALREAGGEGRLWAATLVSLPIWVCIFLFCAVLARGLGLPPETSLAAATFASSLAILTSLLPISAFANFGTLEIGWVLGFGMLGVPRDVALATGTGLHLVQLVNVVALGLLGHVGMGLVSRRGR
jgi:uncharacterized protein (TIRG00374 family)